MSETSTSWWPLLYYSNAASRSAESLKNGKAVTLETPDESENPKQHDPQDGRSKKKEDTKDCKPAPLPSDSNCIAEPTGDSENLPRATSLSTYFQWGYPREISTSERNSGLGIQNNAKGAKANHLEVAAEQKQSNWWWSSGPTEPDKDANASHHSSVAEEPIGTERTWFSWIWSNTEVQNDTDLDPSEQHIKRLFIEAQSAIEAPKSSDCHYAIYNVIGEMSSLIAVKGTKSEEHPVPFAADKKPMLPNEALELGLAYSKSQQDPKVKQSPSMQTNAQFNASPAPQKPSSTETVPPENMQGNPSGAHQPVASSDNNARKVIELNGALDIQREQIVDDNEPAAIPTVLPRLERNLREVTLTTKVRVWGEALLYGDKTSEKHIYKSSRQAVVKKRSRLTKKVVLVSTHSFLPIKFTRSFIGQSTGSAAQFASSGAEAILRWKELLPADTSSNELFDILKEGESIVHSISLEGIGTISDRVESSLKLLRNWSEEIQSADCVLLISNSIACPVNIFLLDEMFKLNADFKLKDKKVGVLNMAGVNSGIFPDIDSKTVRRAYTADENNILREVFELQNEKSEISQKLVRSLKHLCHLNVKLTFCGAVNDQFVPVHSACANNIKHPNMFKCLYTRPGCDVPPFLARLMSMILTMENVGHYDDSLLTDLLDLVQGPINSSGSHGTIVNGREVYDVAVRFAFETTSLKHQKPPQTTESPALVKATQNLYNLPWSVRGLINDLIYIKNVQSRSLINELVLDYKNWNPAARQWKEVKNCFAAFEEVSVDDIFV